MKKAFRFLGIIALVAVIGFLMAGCDDGDGDGEPVDLSNFNHVINLLRIRLYRPVLEALR